MIEAQDPNAAERFDLGKLIVTVGFVAATVVCSVLLLSVAYLALRERPVDPLLKDLALAAFTFLVTSFAPMVRDFITGGAGVR